MDVVARNNLRPLVVLAALALVLTIWQHAAWSRDRISLPEYIAQKLGSPVMSAVAGLNELLHDVALSVLTAHSLAAENRRLRQQCDELASEKVLLTEYFRQNKAILDQLGFAPGLEVPYLPARVTGWTSGKCQITIHGPANREIHTDDIVRQAAGLVGRVIEVENRGLQTRPAGARTAQVLLIIDPEHGLGARDQRSRDVGIVKSAPQWTGGWPDRLQMEKLRREADVRLGDVIITSGQDGIYPDGLPIGVVEAVTASSVSAQTVIATIRPLVDFERLEYVWVIPTP